MEKINLPSFKCIIREEDGVQKIFDSFRMKYVQLTPEEWVRQHFIHFLVSEKAYPKGLLMVEKELNIHGLKRRPDLVVFNRNGEPKLIAEFKAPKIRIDEKVFFQIAMYNKKLNVPFLILSNGLEHFCAKVNDINGKPEFTDDFPSFDEL